MNITYLHNSGFAIEMDDVLLIFDYWKDVGKGRGLAYGTIDAAGLSAYRRVIALASHAHPDHFNPVITTWPRVELVLSDDILANAPNAVMLSPGRSWTPPDDADGLRVEAFGSTDQGVSFLVSLRGAVIFHAGDLNCWHWQDESSPEEAAVARDAFARTLAPIALRVDGTPPHVALLPVDSRLGSDYDEGALAMVRALKPRVVVPMHAHSDAQAVNAFAGRCGGDVRILLERGQATAIDIAN